MDKQQQRAVSRLAKKYLAEYRKWRSFGRTPADARGIAQLFTVLMKGGRNNYFALNRFNRYRKTYKTAEKTKG